MNDIGHRRGRSFSSLLVGAALTWLTGAILPVAAETRSTGMELLLSSPREVATCLCLDRELVELSNEMSARRLELEALSRRVQEREARFREMPAPIIPTEAERAELNRSRQDLDAMIALRDRTSLQRYQPAVMRYNARVVEHTERCVGRILNTLVVDQVSRNLVCPSPDRP